MTMDSQGMETPVRQVRPRTSLSIQTQRSREAAADGQGVESSAPRFRRELRTPNRRLLESSAGAGDSFDINTPGARRRRRLATPMTESFVRAEDEAEAAEEKLSAAPEHKEDDAPLVEEDIEELLPLVHVTPAETVLPLTFLHLDRNSEQAAPSLHLPPSGRAPTNAGIKEQTIKDLERLIIESILKPSQNLTSQLSEYRKVEGFYVSDGNTV